MYRKYTKQEKSEWVRLYEEGFTAQDIAKQYSMNDRASTIYRVLHKAGISPRNLIDTGKRKGRKGGYRRFLPIEEKEIITVYSENNSLKCTAEQFQCEKGTIRRILQRNHIPVRPRGNTPIRFTEEQQNIIIASWKEGKSQNKIGHDLGTSQSKIGKFLQSKGETNLTRQAKGKSHGHWKGGRAKIGKYIGILLESDNLYFSMTNSDNYVLEHRLVMGEALGRPLFPYETVHHIDGDCQNNRLENLQLRFGKHGKGATYRCRSCGSVDIEPIVLK